MLDVRQVGQRLRDAIGEGNIRQFDRDLDKLVGARGEEIRGRSYAMIHRYLAGDALPSLEFLSAAAELRGVRLEWLVTGTGARTEAEETATQATGLVTTDPLRDLIQKAAPELFLFGDAVLASFSLTLRRLVAAYPDPVSDERTEALHRQQPAAAMQVVDPAKLAELAGLLSRAASDPLRCLGLGKMDYPDCVEYYLAVFAAIRRAIPPRGKGPPLEEVLAGAGPDADEGASDA